MNDDPLTDDQMKQHFESRKGHGDCKMTITERLSGYFVE